jgi:hypothetical protein
MGNPRVEIGYRFIDMIENIQRSVKYRKFSIEDNYEQQQHRTAFALGHTLERAPRFGIRFDAAGIMMGAAQLARMTLGEIGIANSAQQ